MYKVSVIMPIYNNEVTLRRAIDSILNQSVFDSELILINDGSTDSSAQICMEYAKREPLLIQVIHQERLGFASARNRGLNLAKGQYVYFADAENILAPRMFETNLQLAEEKKAELVVFGFIEKNEAVEQTPRLPFLLSKERFRNHYRNFHHFFPYELCNKLYQVHYLKERGIQFRNVAQKETAFFNVDVFQDLSKVVFNRYVLCQKEGKSSEEVRQHQQSYRRLHLQLIDHLQKVFTNWELREEYEDLIISEYYELLKTEVFNLSSPALNLSTTELEKEIDRLLQEKQIVEIFDTGKKLPTKSLYERTLWNNFRKRNTRVIINLIDRKKKTNSLKRKIKRKFNQWFID